MDQRIKPVQNSIRRRVMEAEAAREVGQMMRREFGLSPAGAAADLCGSVLRVTLQNAVSPMGRVVAQAPGGEAALADVYAILHDLNRDRMHGLVSRVLGVPVRQSMIEADIPTWDVFITFRLDNSGV